MMSGDGDGCAAPMDDVEVPWHWGEQLGPALHFKIENFNG